MRISCYRSRKRGVVLVEELRRKRIEKSKHHWEKIAMGRVRLHNVVVHGFMIGVSRVARFIKQEYKRTGKYPTSLINDLLDVNAEFGCSDSNNIFFNALCALDANVTKVKANDHTHVGNLEKFRRKGIIATERTRLRSMKSYIEANTPFESQRVADKLAAVERTAAIKRRYYSKKVSKNNKRRKVSEQNLVESANSTSAVSEPISEDVKNSSDTSNNLMLELLLCSIEVRNLCKGSAVYSKFQQSLLYNIIQLNIHMGSYAKNMLHGRRDLALRVPLESFWRVSTDLNNIFEVLEAARVSIQAESKEIDGMAKKKEGSEETSVEAPRVSHVKVDEVSIQVDTNTTDGTARENQVSEVQKVYGKHQLKMLSWKWRLLVKPSASSVQKLRTKRMEKKLRYWDTRGIGMSLEDIILHGFQIGVGRVAKMIQQDCKRTGKYQPSLINALIEVYTSFGLLAMKDRNNYYYDALISLCFALRDLDREVDNMKQHPSLRRKGIIATEQSRFHWLLKTKRDSGFADNKGGYICSLKKHHDKMFVYAGQVRSVCYNTELYNEDQHLLVKHFIQLNMHLARLAKKTIDGDSDGHSVPFSLASDKFGEQLCKFPEDVSDSETDEEGGKAEENRCKLKARKRIPKVFRTQPYFLQSANSMQHNGNAVEAPQDLEKKEEQLEAKDYSNLPDLPIREIYKYLTRKEIFAMAFVCKRTRSFYDDKSFKRIKWFVKDIMIEEVDGRYEFDFVARYDDVPRVYTYTCEEIESFIRDDPKVESGKKKPLDELHQLPAPGILKSLSNFFRFHYAKKIYIGKIPITAELIQCLEVVSDGETVKTLAFLQCTMGDDVTTEMRKSFSRIMSNVRNVQIDLSPQLSVLIDEESFRFLKGSKLVNLRLNPDEVDETHRIVATESIIPSLVQFKKLWACSMRLETKWVLDLIKIHLNNVKKCKRTLYLSITETVMNGALLLEKFPEPAYKMTRAQGTELAVVAIEKKDSGKRVSIESWIPECRKDLLVIYVTFDE